MPFTFNSDNFPFVKITFWVKLKQTLNLMNSQIYGKNYMKDRNLYINI